MDHQTDTPTSFFAVPGHTRLFRREGGTYYLRAKVPDALRPIIGKTEIRKSLRTKTLKEALPLVKIESLRVDREFELAEAKLKGTKAPERRLSREEMLWHVSRYFVELETRTNEWAHAELPLLPRSQRQDYAETLKEDNAALNGSPIYPPEDYTHILDSYRIHPASGLNVFLIRVLVV